VADIQLDIVTPERSAFSGRVDSVLLPAWEGQMGAYPAHALELVLLRGGVATVHSAGSDRRWVVGRGFAEIGPDRVTVLTDLAEPAGTHDVERARADAAEATLEIGATAEGTERRRAAERRREIAAARQAG
jgi:F-type H+-transporting ATPase subunit epsilon